MPKVKPEKVAGIVALSYLVLIPAGAALMWRKIQLLDQDITTMWEKLGMPEENRTSNVDLRDLRRLIGR